MDSPQKVLHHRRNLDLVTNKGSHSTIKHLKFFSIWMSKKLWLLPLSNIIC